MSWSLTFIYEQELRSKWMNDILRGIIRPGVYNANMYLYTKDEEPLGVYLKIKKGTTLIFSNGLSLVNDTYNRSLDELGGYVLKAVVDSDEDIEILSTIGAEAAFKGHDAGVPNAPLLFIGASYKYDPDVAGDLSISISAYRPNYPNSYIPDIPTLPNEDLSSGSPSVSLDTSFLILGTVINTQTSGMLDYVANSLWVTGTVDGDIRWVYDHVFTGRGLPDYSNSISRGFQERLPEFLFSRNINRLFLSEGNINYNGCSYNIDGYDWRTIYGSAGTSYVDDLPSVDQGFTIDYNYADNTQAAWASTPLTTTAEKMYLTIVFMSLRGKTATSETTEPDLANILNPLLPTSEKFFLPINIELVNNPTFITSAKNGALNTELFGGAASCVPLDVSKNNLERLKALFNNQEVFHTVVDYMRRNADIAPYLNPDNGETLVPVFVGLRKTNASNEIDDDPSRLSGGINPVNCLTLKDLQGIPQSNLINVIENVFDIISVME